jgi:hypothetical protein
MLSSKPSSTERKGISSMSWFCPIPMTTLDGVFMSNNLKICKLENCNTIISKTDGNKVCAKHRYRFKKYGSYEIPKKIYPHGIVKNCVHHGFLKENEVCNDKYKTCKKCKNKWHRNWCKNNPERVKELSIKSLKQPHCINRRKKYQNKWQAKRRKEKPEYVNKMNMIYYNRNLEKMRLQRAKYRYGIEPDVYKKIYNDQQGLCLICKKENPDNKSKFLVIDHCHFSESKGIMKIRGLLCGRCNKGLGFFNDDITLMKKAINYLESHQHIDNTKDGLTLEERDE